MKTEDIQKFEGHDVKIFTTNYEEAVVTQLQDLLSVPVFSGAKIRLMPDCHSGAGCCIGFTADLGDYVIPNIVGVDIGCSISVVKLKDTKIDFRELDRVIRERIPNGRGIHEDPNYLTQHYREQYQKSKELIGDCVCYREFSEPRRLYKSLGSLGSGNHFLEVDQDSSGGLYLLAHTGSRNFGKQVAEFYQKEAVRQHQGYDELREIIDKTIREYKEAGRRSELQEKIKSLRAAWKPRKEDVPRDLAYLEGVWKENYLHDMKNCQAWALLNHEVILGTIISEMGWTEEYRFTTTHNYIGEDGIIRKGAVSAYPGELLIIPLNMRDGSLICEGLGNPDWNYSVCHGAGRVLSRSKAFETLKLEDYRESMTGIFSTSVSQDTIDEAPMVYKPAQEISTLIQESVNIKTRITPVYNFKAS